MVVTENNGEAVKHVVTAMIMSRDVLSAIAPHWNGRLFTSDTSNRVGHWCVDYFKKYGDAPRENIQRIYADWARISSSAASTRLMESFLTGLSDKFGDDVRFEVDKVQEYLNELVIRKAADEVGAEIDAGRFQRAWERLSAARTIQLSGDAPLLPLRDPGAFEEAFARDDREAIITYPGAAGEFFKGAFHRGEFYAIVAPDKSGKTAWLVDLAYRALRKQRHILYVDAGDGSASEMLHRLSIRALRRPEYEGRTTLVPEYWNFDGTLKFGEQLLEAADSFMAMRELNRIVWNKDAFRIWDGPSNTVTVAKISNLLKDWHEAGVWRTDVVIVDYADILASPAGSKDTLDAIDENWKQLRRLSQEHDVLVLTATQCKASGYSKTKSLLGREDFSGRKTKNAHVNGMIGINISEDEREQQMARLNWIVRRKTRGARMGVVRVAGCYALENPVMISKWEDNK